MSRDLQISELLERILDADLSAEEVCAEHPELLDEVRAKLRKVRDVELQLESLFPSSRADTDVAIAPFTGSDPVLPLIHDHEIQAVLGRGGMGVVYQARHVKLNRVVALKMLLSGSHAGRQEYLRFVKEAEAAAALKHPNIVQIYDYGEAAGQPYFTMEYVEGGTLAERLAGPIQPVRDSAKMAAALAHAVQAAHRSGVIHRDLKPANILVAEQDVLKISDFGLARRIDGDGGLTQTGMVLGTPNYMAPEQMTGKSSAIGPATDIFALGAILYEMLVGHPPFKGNSFSDAERRLLREDPRPPSRKNSKVPRDLETICLKCLEKDPRQRYATAAELAADLDRFLRHEPIHARPVSPAERGLRWIRRNPLPSMLAVAAVVMIGFIVGNSLRERALTVGRKAEVSRLTERYESALQLVQEERYAEAKAILGKLGDGDSEELRGRIDRALADLKLVEDLDMVGVRRAFVTLGEDDALQLRKIAAEEYAALFAESGLRGARDDLQTVVQRIGRSDIKGTLVAALDDWAVCEPVEHRRAWLLETTRNADPAPDGWPDRARDPTTWHDRNELSRLVATASSEKPSVYLLRAVGERLSDVGLDSIAFYRQVQREHADSFLANFELANALREKDPEESIRFYQAALAIRPHAVPAGNNLAVALADIGRTDEAIVLFQNVLAIDPKSARVHYNLGRTLLTAEQVQPAIIEFRKAVEIKPNFAAAFGALGQALLADKQYAAAETALKQYLALLPPNDAARPTAAGLLRRAQSAEHLND